MYADDVDHEEIMAQRRDAEREGREEAEAEAALRMQVVVFEGDALDDVVRLFRDLTEDHDERSMYRLAVAVDPTDGGFKVKVNGYSWTPACGELLR